MAGSHRFKLTVRVRGFANLAFSPVAGITSLFKTSSAQPAGSNAAKVGFRPAHGQGLGALGKGFSNGSVS